MKKYFNGKGTITGNQAFLRSLLAAVPYFFFNASFVFNGSELAQPTLAYIAIALMIPTIWFSWSTAKKRLQAFGFKGNFLNFLFPVLTDGTYPNGKESEK